MRQISGTRLSVPSAGDDLGDQPLARLEFAVQAADRHLLVALQAERLPGRAFLEHQRQHAHADQVGAVDALERSARSPRGRRAGSVPLAAQSREEPVPYSLPANTTSGTFSAL